MSDHVLFNLLNELKKETGCISSLINSILQEHEC